MFDVEAAEVRGSSTFRPLIETSYGMRIGRVLIMLAKNVHKKSIEPRAEQCSPTKEESAVLKCIEASSKSIQIAREKGEKRTCMIVTIDRLCTPLSMK